MEETKPLSEMSEKEQAIELIKGEINHWKHLEKGLLLNRDEVRKHIGALQFVVRTLEKIE